MGLHSDTRPQEVLPATGFRHEAVLYDGLDDFFDVATAFILEGAAAGESMMVAVTSDKIDGLCEQLGPVAMGVEFVDMAVLGHNPARIIPAWRDFLERHGGRGSVVRGIGEPIWATRNDDELVECQRHEALLNIAIDIATPFTLVCPYDIATLSGTVIQAAVRTHPYLQPRHSSYRRQPGFVDHARSFLDAPLTEPGVPFREREYGVDALCSVRALVSEVAESVGMNRDRRDDLALAVSELATNSVVHGGGRGLIRVWAEVDRLICEFRDRGRLESPMAGREEPPVDGDGHRGLWMVNQLCDLVQIRVFPSGTVVRLHMLIG